MRELPCETYVEVETISQPIDSQVKNVATQLADARQTEATLRMEREQLRARNAHLERTLQETHHRVKNGLQMIASMIDLHLMDGEKMAPVEEFKRIGLAIRTLATVHEVLTSELKDDSDGHDTSCRTILKKLINLLQATTDDHQLSMKLQEIRLPTREATCLALVTNEIVSNAIKHGASRVDIKLYSTPSGRATLEVRDDGPGFPPDFDPVAAAHTGLDLIINLVRYDLTGETRFENYPQGGANVIVTFPTPAP